MFVNYKPKVTVGLLTITGARFNVVLFLTGFAGALIKFGDTNLKTLFGYS